MKPSSTVRPALLLTFALLLLGLLPASYSRAYNDDVTPEGTLRPRQAESSQAVQQNPWPLYLQMPFEPGATWLESSKLYRDNSFQHTQSRGGALDLQPFTPITWLTQWDNTDYPVVAVASGTLYKQDDGCLFIDHDGVFQSYYWHVEQIQVAHGTRVYANQHIAYIADTENEARCEPLNTSATAPHLHFHVRQGGEPNVGGGPNTRYMEGLYLSGYQVGWTGYQTSYTRNNEPPVYSGQDRLTSQYQPFWDVPPSNKHFAAIQNLARREFTTGFSDGSFRADSNITRGEVTKFLARSAADDVVRGDGSTIFPDHDFNPFLDVNDNNSFYAYIRFLANKETDPEIRVKIGASLGEVQVVTGHSDGNFRPGNAVTRGEYATMVGRLFEAKEKEECEDGPSPFLDVPEGSTHEKYITCLAGMGWVKGYSDGLFYPDDTITRGQAASILSAMLDATQPYCPVVEPLCQGTQPAHTQEASSTDTASSTSNNTCPLITVGQEMVGFTPGYNNQVNCVQVNVSNPNSRYWAEVRNQGWNANLQLEVRDPSNNVVATRSQQAQNGAFSLHWQATQIGNYSVYITNISEFSKEAADYSITIHETTGTREYRVDMADNGVCGTSDHLSLEIQPESSDVIEINMRKCDETTFGEGGRFWVLVDGQEVSGWEFNYSSGGTVKLQDIRPADKGIFGRHEYQIKVWPSNQPSREMRTGVVRSWEVYVPFEGDYVYGSISPTDDDDACGGVIKLRLTPDLSDHNLRARVRKCDETSFVSSGRFYITVGGERRWGPFHFDSGVTSLYVDIDPYGGYSLVGRQTYRAEMMSDCSHGDPDCNPTAVQTSGPVRAYNYMKIAVTARRDGVPWNAVGIWRDFPTGSPLGFGHVEEYMPDAAVAWYYYLAKQPGYTVDDTTPYYVGDSATHYVVQPPLGRSAVLDYIQECYALILVEEPSTGGEISATPEPNCSGNRYTNGTQVTLSALPQGEHTFAEWGGSASGTTNPVVVTMDDDKSVTAIFNQPCYTVTVQSVPLEGGTISVLTPPTCADNEYQRGTEVAISASANPGYEFVEWGGDVTGGSASIVVAIDSDMLITGTFSPPPPTPTAIATNTPVPTSTPAPTQTPTNTPTPPDPLAISDIRVSNVRDTSFTVSWITNTGSEGHIRYGNSAATVTILANDIRGASTVDDTHYVTIGDLQPGTTYYFDVVSDGSVDDNDGAHHTVTTGPSLPPPSSDTIYGQVFLSDGTTPAAGTLVYLSAMDANGSGSPGQSAPLSALVDGGGYWFTNLGNARQADLTQPFIYSPSGDHLDIEAVGAAAGIGCRTVDTGDDDPAAAVTLGASCTVEATIGLQPSWNHIGFPIEPGVPYTAESLCDEIIAQGGVLSEVDRWIAGGWDGHLCNLPFNDFPVTLGGGYFVRSGASSTLTIEGLPVTGPRPLTLAVGWNSVSIPYVDSHTAESLCDSLIAQGVQAVEIDRWHAGGWDGHLCNLPFNDFPIQPGRGYFIKSNSAGTVTPSAAAPLAEPTRPTVWPAEPGAALPIANLRVTDLREGYAVVSWTTAGETSGYVQLTQLDGRVQRFHDVRGVGARARTHVVVLDGLAPQTSYVVEVVSGDGASKEARARLPVTTLSAIDRIPAPDRIYGQIFLADGRTPATGALVSVSHKPNEMGSERDVAVLTTLVDEAGYWSVDLANLRRSDGQTVGGQQGLTLSVRVDPTRVYTYDLDPGALRPAPHVVLKVAGTER